jgi:5-methylcytosine-specific restriction protein A
MKAEYDRRRPSAAIRGYDRKWRRYRLAFLASHPLCAECNRNARITEATEVDHIKPHGNDPQLFWDPDNHQSLCKSCHSSKTASEHGFKSKSYDNSNQIKRSGQTIFRGF